jgi:hypothetical protein
MRPSFLIVASAALAAGDAAAAGPLTGTLSLAYESRYVFRGFQYSEGAIQPAATLGYKGAYVAAWANLPAGDEGSVATPDWQEIDLVAGWSGPLAGRLSIDAGLTYYAYPSRQRGFFDLYEEDGDGLGANTIEPYVGLILAAPLSPKLYVYRDLNFDAFTVQGTVAKSIPLADRFSIDLGGTIGHVFDDEGGTDYLYGQASANLAYALSPVASAYVGVRYGGSDLPGGGLFDDGTTDPSGFWWGVGLTAKF